jgi:hypothetical protein
MRPGHHPRSFSFANQYLADLRFQRFRRHRKNRLAAKRFLHRRKKNWKPKKPKRVHYWQSRKPG